MGLGFKGSRVVGFRLKDARVLGDKGVNEGVRVVVFRVWGLGLLVSGFRVCVPVCSLVVVLGSKSSTALPISPLFFPNTLTKRPSS